MLLWIIVTYLVIGVLIMALVTKGTFWFNEHKDMGWIGYILALIIITVIAPYSIVSGTIQGLISLKKRS